jgi:glycosyltransferase involved in cell wall biosynthesis
MEFSSKIKDMKQESLESANFKLSAFDPSLKIGFDGKRAARNFTGLGNYSRYIIQILATYFPKNEYRVYSSQSFDQRSSNEFIKYSSVNVCLPKRSWLNALWRSFGIIKDLGADGIQLFHGLSNEIPFGIRKSGISTVVTVHDLIFLRYPHYYPWIDRKIYQFKVGYACRHADKIIAISEQTKRDIVKFYNITPGRIKVIYQNCSPPFQNEVFQNKLDEVRIRYSLPAKYLLNVGTIEARKNVMVIVQALRNIDPAVHLVVIGKQTSYAEKVKELINKHKLHDRVHFLKNIPLEDLPAIYRQAEIFIYPSEFEGFGIPIIEALHSQVPVIAASGSCLEEAGGPTSLYVRPDDEQGLVNSIDSILNNPQKRITMVEEGLKYVKRFSDNLIATELMKLYKNL